MVFAILIVLIHNFAFATETRTTDKFIIQGLSFVHHSDQSSNYKEDFANHLALIGYRIGAKTHILAGTIINSHDERCFVGGVNHEWKPFNDYLSFTGGYAYVGPILGQFSRCYNASHGANPFIGWCPFVFHGISFKPFKAINFRINSGYILGGMYTTYLEYRF